MRRIDYIENPTWNQILELKNQFPQEVFSVLEHEVTHGNAILNIGDAGGTPSSTYINIQLQREPSQEYDNLMSDGSPYKKLYFYHANTCIWFGTIKPRKKKFKKKK